MSVSLLDWKETLLEVRSRFTNERTAFLPTIMKARVPQKPIGVLVLPTESLTKGSWIVEAGPAMTMT